MPPEKVPDFIGLKGDTSDNIPGVPGIGDKTAGELIGRFGSLEEVLAHVDELTPARARAMREHADQARDSKLLATMRRDLDVDIDPAALVLAPPDRSTLKEIFRRFEFRNVLRRVDELDSALPAAERPVAAGFEVAWEEGAPARVEGTAAVVAEKGRAAIAEDGRPIVVTADLDGLAPALRDSGRLVVHGSEGLPSSLWRAGVEPAEDTELAAYLVDPNRSGYVLDDLAAEYGIEPRPEPPAEPETEALVRRAASTLALVPPLLERLETSS